MSDTRDKLKDFAMILFNFLLILLIIYAILFIFDGLGWIEFSPGVTEGHG